MNQENLEWGWKPILIAMRFIGYDLRDPLVSPKNSWFTFYSFLCLAYTAFLHVFDCVDNTTFFVRVLDSDPPSNISLVVITNVMVDTYNNAFHSVGIQLTVFLMARSNWNEMWHAVQRVGRRFDFKFYENLRIVSSSAVVAVVMIELYLLASGTIYTVLSPRLTLALHGKLFALILAEVHRICGSTLFIVCALSASNVFSQLKNEIDEASRYLNPVDASSILKWKHTHALVCVYVDSINRCFGPILLIDIFCMSLRMINSVFQVSVGLNVHKSRSSIYHTLYSFELFFQFWIVCIVASRLQIKATNIILAIRKLKTTSLDTQRLAGALLIQVHHSAPSISAYGLVKINHKLVLKLIGTTFSYFVIINQFYLLEDPLQQ